jgi:hypothetical protein
MYYYTKVPAIIQYRLFHKLPLRNDNDIDYFKKRFFWIIAKYQIEFFVNGNKMNTHELIDRVFKALIQEWQQPKLMELSQFIRGLGTSICKVANQLGFELKVTTDFFADQFLRVVCDRFRYQNDFIVQYYDFFLLALKNVGFVELEAAHVILSAVQWAETVADYNCTTKQFLDDLINDMILKCVSRGKYVKREMFVPKDFENGTTLK